MGPLHYQSLQVPLRHLNIFLLRPCSWRLLESCLRLLHHSLLLLYEDIKTGARNEIG
jgi:hypothetical protein